MVVGAWSAVTSIGTYFATLTAFEITKRVIIGVFVVTFLAFAFSFIYFFFEAMMDIYNIISNFLEYVSNPPNLGSVSILNQMFGVLNCSGVIAGINAIDGMILSAVSFRLMIAIFKHFGKFVYVTLWAISLVIK